MHISISCYKIFLLVSRYLSLWPWPFFELAIIWGICFSPTHHVSPILCRSVGLSSCRTIEPSDHRYAPGLGHVVKDKLLVFITNVHSMSKDLFAWYFLNSYRSRLPLEEMIPIVIFRSRGGQRQAHDINTTCCPLLALLLNLVQWLFLKVIVIYRSGGHRSKSNC